MARQKNKPRMVNASGNPVRVNGAMGTSAQTSMFPAGLHVPAKNPTLLLISFVLFALWFVFLLIVAVWG